jgi:hypothetical protein
VGLFFIALATVGCSFAFAAFVFLHMADRETSTSTSAPPAEAGNDTMQRVIGDIERLAALRERGALTTKEFNEQKALALSAQPDAQ